MSELPAQPTLPLFLLAFDHRRSIRPLFGIEGEPTPQDALRIAAAKRTIYDGLLRARGALDGVGIPGVLVDEEYGGEVLDLVRAEPDIVAAVAAERSGQAEFQLEYSADFEAHIERFEPELVKALVRFNPDGDAELNGRQVERLASLSDRLREAGRELLFELLVPPTPEQLGNVENDPGRFDAELRPELVCRAVVDLQGAGIEPAVWKIEGIEDRSGCELVAATCRRDGRDEVRCLILGRGADESRVEHWLRVAAPVAGFGGFAVGRTIWWEATAANLAGEIGRDEAAATIAGRYRRLIDVYCDAVGSAAGVRAPAPTADGSTPATSKASP